LSASINLQAVLTVLVTGRVAHIRVVCKRDARLRSGSPIPRGLPVGEPGRDPQLETATTWVMIYPSQGGNALCQGLNGTRVEKHMVLLTIFSGNQVTPCYNRPFQHIRSSVLSCLLFSGTRGTEMETRKTNTIKQDRDSLVERNPQSLGQEGVEANIPRVALSINPSVTGSMARIESNLSTCGHT
jgi:hypothetical protein